MSSPVNSAVSPQHDDAPAVLGWSAPVNKAGQKLGRKGLETRTRLLIATREMLERWPEQKLTPSTIARQADVASQTFYLYFNDVEEALLILIAEASKDNAPVIAAIEQAVKTGGSEAMERFIRAFYAMWDKHRPLLALRNYYSDNGEARFYKLRTDCSLPIVHAIAGRLSTSGALSAKKCLARAVIIYSALERSASRAHTTALAAGDDLLTNADFMSAEADILALMLENPDYRP